MNDNQNLNDLIRRIRNSDPSAKDIFDDVLYSRVSDRLLKYVLSKYGSTLDAEDAMDVVHSTFLTMMVKSSQYRGPNAMGWIYSILRTQASRMVKVKKRTAFSLDASDEDEGSAPFAAPERSSPLSDINWEGEEFVEERATNSCFLKSFRKHSDKLTVDEQDILHLRYDESLSYEEIGSRQNRTKVRAKQKHDGAIAKIRLFLRLD